MGMMTDLLFYLLIAYTVYILVQSCRFDEFECNSSKTCIDITLRCNADFDCSDFSDETDCVPQNFCPEAQFRCRNGLCVASDAKCNDIIQCPDGSDEDSCDESIQVFSYTSCSEKSTTCQFGSTILTSTDTLFDIERSTFNNDLALPTDSISTTPLVSTLLSMTMAGNICASDEFECDPSNVCIKMSLRCDYNFDCPDYSDELDCVTLEICPEGQFMCRNGLCVVVDAKCNGKVQCPDGSDEDGCGNAVQVSTPTVWTEKTTTFRSFSTELTSAGTVVSEILESSEALEIPMPTNVLSENEHSSSNTGFLYIISPETHISSTPIIPTTINFVSSNVAKVSLLTPSESADSSAILSTSPCFAVILFCISVLRIL